MGTRAAKNAGSREKEEWDCSFLEIEAYRYSPAICSLVASSEQSSAQILVQSHHYRRSRPADRQSRAAPQPPAPVDRVPAWAPEPGRFRRCRPSRVPRQPGLSSVPLSSAARPLWPTDETVGSSTALTTELAPIGERIRICASSSGVPTALCSSPTRPPISSSIPRALPPLFAQAVLTPFHAIHKGVDRASAAHMSGYEAVA